uniref:Paxillin-like n=1 Tax=Lepisosteus oculatus TaxID=7918 RepID=W5MVN1_LEPOC|nr:PREDICTED: leupaxin-like isoform X1 [Lepisosteus oculatus]
MDELDSLLEELAVSSSQSSEGQDNTSTRGSRGDNWVQPVYTTKLPAKPAQEIESEHVYSEVPHPEEACLLSPGSATRELEAIMTGLLELDLGLPDRSPSSALPVLAKRGKEKEKEPEKKDKAMHSPAEPETTGKTPNKTPTKTAQHPPGAEGASIDHLLGVLSSDMEKMGVHTAAKGHCAACGKCIVGKVITAMGMTWHPEHFVCCVCKEELGVSCGFFERDGKPYCETDYQNIFAPRCAYCNGPILQNILTALDRSWHPEHFFCTACGHVFGSEGFLEREGKPYCHADFYRLYAPKCSGCGDPVRENYLSAANGTWHTECFVCADCLSPFQDGCFMELDGRPLCTLHFHARQGTLCGGCEKPISGRCIAALGRKFHPDHFVCAFCLRQLAQGVFKEREGKPYCAGCHQRLFLS